MITFFMHNFTTNPERSNGFTGVRFDVPDGYTAAQACDKYITDNNLPTGTVIYSVAIGSYTWRQVVAQPNTGASASVPTLPANGT